MPDLVGPGSCALSHLKFMSPDVSLHVMYDGCKLRGFTSCKTVQSDL